MKRKTAKPQRKENIVLQHRMVLISLIVDALTALPVIAVSILSNSMILLADIYDYSYNIISNLIALIIVGKILKGKIVSYDYGSGKLESMSSLFTSLIVVGGLLVTAGFCIWRFIHPAHISEEFTLIGFLINFIALLINIYLWWKVYSIAVESGSRIMEFQWRMHRANALSCAGVFVALSLALLLRGYSYGIYVDPACALLFIVIAAFEFINLIKDNLEDLLDKTLEESIQISILKRLAEYFDYYEAFHGVKSRRVGKKKMIDISLGFSPSRTCGEIFDISSRLREKIENDIPKSEVKVFPGVDKDFEDVCSAMNFYQGLEIKPLSEDYIEASITLLKHYLPKENYDIVGKALKESCQLGTHKEELLMLEIMNPRFWIILSDEKLICIGGIYLNPEEHESVYGGWTVVDKSFGITASRAFKLISLKMLFEARKTGRKYFRAITSDLPEEAMMNKSYENVGMKIFKTGIDYDSTNLLYRQGEIEKICQHLCRH